MTIVFIMPRLFYFLQTNVLSRYLAYSQVHAVSVPYTRRAEPPEENKTMVFNVTKPTGCLLRALHALLAQLTR